MNQITWSQRQGIDYGDELSFASPLDESQGNDSIAGTLGTMQMLRKRKTRLNEVLSKTVTRSS